jgi:hypothetical protein
MKVSPIKGIPMKKWFVLIVCCWIPVSAQQIPVPAISFSPPSYVCYKTGGLISVDGVIKEASWERADWTDNFVDIEGSAKPNPRFRTRAKMLWDTLYLYIAAELEESDVWATLTQHDAVIFYDNDFEIFIDPDGDTHQYYELEMNALNTVWELFLVQPYRDGGPAINAWDISGLKTAVNIRGTVNKPGDQDKGWSVEIAIPWSVLKECARPRTLPKSGDQWRINFSRVEWKMQVADGMYQKVKDPVTGKPFPEDNWVWAPQGLINIHYPEMWGFVQFSENIVGTSRDTFSFRAEENVKWLLRQIYYAERKYYGENGQYTDNAGLLKIPRILTDGFLQDPWIFHTPNLYEAIITSKDGKTGWHIDQKGRTWRQ